MRFSTFISSTLLVFSTAASIPYTSSRLTIGDIGNHDNSTIIQCHASCDVGIDVYICNSPTYESTRYTITVKSDSIGNPVEGAEDYVTCLISCLGLEGEIPPIYLQTDKFQTFRYGYLESERILMAISSNITSDIPYLSDSETSDSTAGKMSQISSLLRSAVNK